MGLLSGLFRGFISGLVVSALFALVGISLFVGSFPPTTKQIKQVFSQFQNLQNYKQQVLNQVNPPSAEDLPLAMEQARRRQLNKFAASRGERPMNSYERYQQEVDRIGNEDQYDEEEYARPRRHRHYDNQDDDRPMRGRAVANSDFEEAEGAPRQRMQVPEEIRNQMYTLRAEISKLNQRVFELEQQKLQRK